MNRADPAWVAKPTSELLSNMSGDWALVSHCVKEKTKIIMSKTDSLGRYSEKNDEEYLGRIVISFAQFLLLLLFTSAVVRNHLTILFVFSKAENSQKQPGTVPSWKGARAFCLNVRKSLLLKYLMVVALK